MHLFSGRQWTFPIATSYGAWWLVVYGLRSVVVVSKRVWFQCGVPVLGCFCSPVRSGGLKSFFVSARGGCFGLFMVSIPLWWCQNVFRFRAVWLSGVVSLFRSAMVVAFLFLFRCGMAVWSCLCFWSAVVV